MTTPNAPATIAPGALMTIREAAQALGRNEAAFRQQAQRRTVPTVRVGGRRLVPRAYVEALARGEQWEPGVTANAAGTQT